MRAPTIGELMPTGKEMKTARLLFSRDIKRRNDWMEGVLFVLITINEKLKNYDPSTIPAELPKP